MPPRGPLGRKCGQGQIHMSMWNNDLGDGVRCPSENAVNLMVEPPANPGAGGAPPALARHERNGCAPGRPCSGVQGTPQCLIRRPRALMPPA